MIFILEICKMFIYVYNFNSFVAQKSLNILSSLSQSNYTIYTMSSKRWAIRVGWWISKVVENGVKWKLLGIETAVVKGFFSKISILGDKWLLKIAKKMRKCVFLFNGLELERVIQFRPPLFFNFRGGHTSSILSNSCSFLRYAFLGLKFIFQNNDFWEKSFYYSSFYA